MRLAGTAQREILYSYSVQDGFICTRSEYNAKGQLVKQYRDTGVGTDAMAATFYEYDAMGHLTRETLALAEDATVENSPVTEWVYGAESTEEGVFSLTTTTRYNAAGQALSSTQKQLISQLNSTLEGKMISVSERGLTFMQWSVYNEATKRTQYSTVPASSITAEAVTADGWVLMQVDCGRQTILPAKSRFIELCTQIMGHVCTKPPLHEVCITANIMVQNSCAKVLPMSWVCAAASFSGV